MTSDPDLFSSHGEKAVVLLFVRSDCPISNRYAPDLERIYEKYSPRGVDFRLVYPESGLTVSALAKHREEYGYTIPALLDTRHQYVKRAGAHITPEAAVFVHGELIYLGRIDDRYADIGKARREATRHDLEEVLGAIVAGKSIRRRETKAVGCTIENLK
jgi:thiol-disulfide isomerase/thioredoxin